MDLIFITRNLLHLCLLFTILHNYSGVSGASLQNIFASGCSKEVIKLSCPLDHKIGVKRLFFGVKADRKCTKQGRQHSPDCCKRTHNDCIVFNEDMYTSLNMNCSGYQTCDFESKKVSARRFCSKQNMHFTDYMTIIYNCIPDKEIAQFCTNSVKQGKSLYLSNKDYPAAIHRGDHQCRCVVTTGFSQGLIIQAIDIMITHYDFSDVCLQRLRIQDTYGQNRVIQCGEKGWYGFRIVYDRMVSNVTLELESNSPKDRGYVFLNLKSQNEDDYVSLFCGDSMAALNDATGVRNVTVKPVTTSVHPAINVTVKPYGWQTPHLIPDLVAIIAGISAAVALIILVCLVAIAVHCTRVRENRRMPKLPEVIPSPMLRGKNYSPDDPDDMQHRYNYDEERYCSIKRSPMKMTTCSDLPDHDSERKLKEAFLAGEDEVETNETHLVNGVPPRPPSPDPALLSPDLLDQEDPPPAYNGFGEKYYTMNPQKPKTEIAEIRITSSLPHRGNKNKGKSKTVTFSPVAMVTPLPSGSEESIGSDGDRNLANVIDIYQNLQGGGSFSPEINKGRRVVILPPTMEELEIVHPPPPNPSEMAEMEDLWKTITDTTTMDEGAYDNIEYLLAQNRQNYGNDKPQNIEETGV